MIFHKRYEINFTNTFISKSKNALLSIAEVFEHDTRREREKQVKRNRQF